MHKRFLVPSIALALVVLAVLVGFKINGSIRPAGQQPGSYDANLSKFQSVIRHLSANYFEQVNEDKLFEDAIIGMLKGLDPHTFYIPAKEMQQIAEQMQGSFQGIGVEFSLVEDTIFVITPIAGGPSEKLGVQAGDRIVTIEGNNVAGIGITNNDVIKKLRGEKGSKVKVAVKRAGVKNLIDFEITRDEIPLNSVDFSYMVDKTTGYIRVNRFSETTDVEFHEHLTKLKNAGLENLILDLRNNGGGYLDKARKMADMFLTDKKLIVYTKGRIPSNNHRYETTPGIRDFEEGGLIVLINQGSASASEIVSGAVQDWDRGLIVGQRSYGKGLVQQQYLLSDGAAIRVVVSRYYTPAGRCIQKPYKTGSSGSKDYEAELDERIESGELLDPTKVKMPDSLKFTTNGGRTVYGGGGIMPDIFVPIDTSGQSNYLASLAAKNIFRNFSLRYIEHHPNLKTEYKDGNDFVKRFDVSDAVIKEFTTYAAEKSVPYVESDFQASKKYILQNIKSLIGRSAFGDVGFYPVFLANDATFQKALSLIPEAKKMAKK